VIGHRRSVSAFRSTRALRGWQHVRVPCSAWIPLPPATGQAAVDVRDLRRGLPDNDEPNGSCRAVDGHVDAQTTLRTGACDCRWFAARRLFSD